MASIAKFDQWQNAAGVNYNSVITYAYSSTSQQYSNSSSTYTNSGLSLTINKKISSSYILLLPNPSLQAYRAGSGDARAFARLYDSTNGRVIETFPNCIRSYDAGDVNVVVSNILLACVDTNAGTGSRTYQLQIANINGSDVRLNIDTNGEAMSYFHAMEIAQ